MSLTTIINLVLAVILVVCAWQGFKKGIIMGIIDVLVIILSLYGARLLSNTYAYEVIPVLRPFVSGVMDSRVEDTAFSVLGYEPDEEGDYHVDQSLTDLLAAMPESRLEIGRWTYRALGVYEDQADVLAQKTIAYMDENSTSLPAAVTQVICETVTWYGGFFIAFILLFTVMTVVVNLPNLSFRIPYVGILNDLGGLAIGLYVGMLLCSILALVLQFTGLVLPQETVREAGVAAWISKRDLLSTLITF